MENKYREDPKFISSTRDRNDIDRLRQRYPDGVPVEMAAKMIGLTPDEYRAELQKVLAKLREELDDTQE